MIPSSECRCFICQKKLPYGDNCVNLTVGSIQENGFEPESHIPYNSYQPAFAHEDCWEEMEEEMLERLNCPDDETEPKELICSICKNEIELADLFAIKQLGFLKVSDFSPNGEVADEFNPLDGPREAICVDCLSEMRSEEEEDDNE